MAQVADHLSVSALEEKYRSCTDVTAARHVQAIWLLAKGHDIAEVSATVLYARRWVERLLARYNAEGLDALGDLRRRNGTRPSVLKCWTSSRRVFVRRRPMVGCGPVQRWRPGWQANSGLPRSYPNVAGRR